MSDMLQTFVKKEMEKQIQEKYSHMQHPPGVYANVVQAKEIDGRYVYTLKILNKAMNIDNDFPEIPNVKTDIELKEGDVAVILLLYDGNDVFVLGRHDP